MTEEVARPGLEALDGRDAVAVSILIALPVALYAPVAGDSASPFSVSREGSLFILLTGDVKLRIRHETPDGRIGLSPLLSLQVRDGTASVTWTTR
ncbi:MAG: hypothetical protein ACXVID_11375 [Thermoanaerobaculia bacterium]